MADSLELFVEVLGISFKIFYELASAKREAKSGALRIGRRLHRLGAVLSTIHNIPNVERDPGVATALSQLRTDLASALRLWSNLTTTSRGYCSAFWRADRFGWQELDASLSRTVDDLTLSLVVLSMEPKANAPPQTGTSISVSPRVVVRDAVDQFTRAVAGDALTAELSRLFGSTPALQAQLRRAVGAHKLATLENRGKAAAAKFSAFRYRVSPTNGFYLDPMLKLVTNAAAAAVFSPCDIPAGLQQHDLPKGIPFCILEVIGNDTVHNAQSSPGYVGFDPAKNTWSIVLDMTTAAVFHMRPMFVPNRHMFEMFVAFPDGPNQPWELHPLVDPEHPNEVNKVARFVAEDPQGQTVPHHSLLRRTETTTAHKIFALTHYVSLLKDLVSEDTVEGILKDVHK